MVDVLSKHWKLIVLSALVTIILFFGILTLVIGRQVTEVVQSAGGSAENDPVLALVAVVQDPTADLTARNKAVWALGQLGDARALSTLEPLVNQEECDHAQSLCQRELGKAIRLCRGDWNPGAMVWRRGELAQKGIK